MLNEGLVSPSLSRTNLPELVPRSGGRLKKRKPFHILIIYFAEVAEFGRPACAGRRATGEKI